MKLYQFLDDEAQPGAWCEARIVHTVRAIVFGHTVYISHALEVKHDACGEVRWRHKVP